MTGRAILLLVVAGCDSSAQAPTTCTSQPCRSDAAVADLATNDLHGPCSAQDDKCCPGDVCHADNDAWISLTCILVPGLYHYCYECGHQTYSDQCRDNPSTCGQPCCDGSACATGECMVGRSDWFHQCIDGARFACGHAGERCCFASTFCLVGLRCVGDLCSP